MCPREQRCDKRRETVTEIVEHLDLGNEADVDPPSLPDADIHFAGDVAEAQRADPTLAPLFKKAEVGACFFPALGKEVFTLRNNILYRQSEDGF